MPTRSETGASSKIRSYDTCVGSRRKLTRYDASADKTPGSLSTTPCARSRELEPTSGPSSRRGRSVMISVRPKAGARSKTPVMMGAWQTSSAPLKVKKYPPPSQRFDPTAAIWPQMWMPVRQTSFNRYDPCSAKIITAIKSVTVISGHLLPISLLQRQPHIADEFSDCHFCMQIRVSDLVKL